MKRTVMILLAGCLICLMTGAQGLCEEPPRMDNSAFPHPRRPAALFDHDTHNENAGVDDCAVCHHVWKDGKLVAGESSEDSPCSECHGPKATAENDVSLTAAFHTKCRACHIKEGKGPLLCGQCHANTTKGGAQ